VSNGGNFPVDAVEDTGNLRTAIVRPYAGPHPAVQHVAMDDDARARAGRA
jgi:hypothetical protein